MHNRVDDAGEIASTLIDNVDSWEVCWLQGREKHHLELWYFKQAWHCVHWFDVVCYVGTAPPELKTL